LDVADLTRQQELANQVKCIAFPQLGFFLSQVVFKWRKTSGHKYR